MSSSSSTQQLVLIAHRGASADAPENTLPAFDAALAQGFANFETDVQLTADGVPVVLHDEQLGRVNDGPPGGRVADTSWQALQALDAGGWFGGQYAGTRIPSLAQVLRRYAGRAHIHLELKSTQPDLPAAVARVLRECGWVQAAGSSRQQPSVEAAAAADQQAAAPAAAAGGCQAGLFAVPGLTVTSFHLQQLLASLALLGPATPHGWLIQEVTQEAIETARQHGLAMVCPRANALTRDGVAQLRAQGFAVRAWGVKSIELLHHVAACCVDGATVNWPAAAASALAAAGGTT